MSFYNDSMFIRSTSQKNQTTGQRYRTYRLVETYRNANGRVRQQTLLNLGSDFAIPKENWKLLADRIEEIMEGQQSILDLNPELEQEADRIAKLVLAKTSDIWAYTQQQPQSQETVSEDYQTIDINSLEHQGIRKIGVEHVGVHAAQQLQLDRLLTSVGFNSTEVNLALATIIGRLVCPGSELRTHRYLSRMSALDELLGTDFSNLSLKNFYKIADKLYKHKSTIESSLYQREQDLFNFKETITLYDLTNTYFEGRPYSNDKAQYGRSKEKRHDSCLVALGMVLDGSGFPKRSHIFPGNVAEPNTLQEMLNQLGDQHATIVMDAGIATEENINWLKEQNRTYIVVSRKQTITVPEQPSVTVKQTRHNEVTAQLVDNQETGELELYCHSSAKQQQSQSMIDKLSQRFETELTKAKQGLQKRGCVKKYQAVSERVGRLKQRYSKAAKYYEITIEPDDQREYAVDITWQTKDNVCEERLGYYCLRTNRRDLDATTFWQTYTMLTDLEAAFRSLKSELGLRPVYHQKEKRVDAHLFISIIAYHLLHTIRYQLKAQGIHASWQTLRDILGTQCRITSSCQLENGQTLHIRKTSLPDAHQKQIYDALGIATQPGHTQKTYR